MFRFKYLFFNVNRIRIQSFHLTACMYKFVCTPHFRYLHSSSNKLSNTDILSSPQKDFLQLAAGTELSDVDEIKNDSGDLLGECLEDVSEYTPYHVPSFNLAAYVNKSYTLQQLVHLGVSLHQIEGIKGAAEAILKLDFERDVKKYLLFFNDIGIPADQYGQILSECPTLLFQDIENLQVRMNYLELKKFSSADAIRIFTNNPTWFTWRTQDIDRRLGFFQNDFKLSGDEIRNVSVKRPKLITHKLSLVKLVIFSVREEMGFTRNESKALLLNKPKIYTSTRKQLVARFDFLHNVMKLSHSFIVQQPDGLLHRKSRLEARHGFLSSLSRDQYDPTKPNYVSLLTLLSGTDAYFATNVAKASIQTYNDFLKSL